MGRGKYIMVSILQNAVTPSHFDTRSYLPSLYPVTAGPGCRLVAVTAVTPRPAGGSPPDPDAQGRDRDHSLNKSRDQPVVAPPAGDKAQEWAARLEETMK